jgi:hypothetical protein
VGGDLGAGTSAGFECGRGDGLARLAEVALGGVLRLPEPRPRPDQALQLWLDPGVAKRLARAGFHQVAQVWAAVRETGPLWWRCHRGLGEAVGRAVWGWCQAWAVAPAPALPVPAEAAPAGLIVGLQRPELDGSAGVNRERQRRCRIDARNDVEALQAWLGLLDPAGGSTRIYRREVERLLLWCLIRRGIAFSSLDTPGCAAYLQFLAQPDDDWLGPYGAARGSADWKPFRQRRQASTGEPVAGLSPASQRLARTVLNRCCDWLDGAATRRSDGILRP